MTISAWMRSTSLRSRLALSRAPHKACGRARGHHHPSALSEGCRRVRAAEGSVGHDHAGRFAAAAELLDGTGLVAAEAVDEAPADRVRGAAARCGYLGLIGKLLRAG